MKNPFKFDIEVEGAYFCGREDDIDEVTDYIHNQTNLIMFSKRRIGKSSLIKEIFLNKLDKTILTAHIDIYSISNIRELYEHLKYGIESSLVKEETSLDKLAQLSNEIKEYFINTDIKLTLSATPKLEINSTQKDYYKALEQLFFGYFAFLKKNNLHAVIAIDEFQKIISLNNSEKVEALLRTIVNKRDNCSFIFTGSKRTLLLSLFNRSDRPFFKLGVEYQLDAIDFKEFYSWISDRFKRKNIIIESEAFRYLYDESDGETRFIQLVSYQIFRKQNSDTIVTLAMMINFIESIIERKKDLAVLLDTYTTAQQNCLKIIAISDGMNIFEDDLVGAYDIKVSSIQSALKSLMDKGIVFKIDKKIQFEDVEFKLWLKRV
ncbi:MAG: ATP-binding protein [Campylobacterota bacterium]|nr:ATP-binding protein [Campylobacterota bacterium]